MPKYNKLYLMVGATSILMYGVMYLNNYSLEHLYFSQTRIYMVAMMASIMMLAMLYFMRKTYRHKAKNYITVGISLFLFASSFYLVRSQDTIDDVAWMKAMIPHHSTAILTSERANLADPRVRHLAREIIANQESEIIMMRRYIDELEGEAREDLYLEDSNILAE